MQNHPEMRLRDLAQTLWRFPGRAQIFQDSCFLRNHFIPPRNDEIFISLIFSAEGGSFPLPHHCHPIP